MKLITNRISTGTARSFEDFVADYKKANQVKTASVKTAEQEEADSSGQLDVEPLHQTGESTTMPKAGPSAKKDTDEKSATATKEPDAEGPDSGQPKAEGEEKFTNDPEVPTKEEKGGSTEEEVKKAELTPAQEKLPDALKEKIKAKQGDGDEEDKEEDKKEVADEETKEAGKTERGKRDGTGPYEGSAQKAKSDKGKRQEAGEKCPFKEDDKDDKDDKKKDASNEVKFVKVGNLDEKNKGFLKEYWRQLYGDDYADAMIADK